MTTRIQILRSALRNRRRLPSRPLSVNLARRTIFVAADQQYIPIYSHSHQYQNQTTRPFSLYVSPEDDDYLDENPPLASLNQTQLQYPNSPKSYSIDLQIAPATEGGHVLLGTNGSGKSLISNALAAGFQHYRKGLREGSPPSENPDFFQQGELNLSDDLPWHGQAMAHVSFESHEQLLALRDERGEPYSVQKAIASGGTLNKAAQFLVVRFGMFPLLHRFVNTLSTGEIRKVLIIKALANRPRLLVLDNAFDGLDVPSRASLKELVAKTLQGFRPDILVQGVDAKNTAHTQVLMITHRPEEIVDPITTVSYWKDGQMVTEERGDQSGEILLKEALGLPKNAKLQEAWTDPSLPSEETMSAWWQQGGRTPNKDTSGPLVSMDNIHIQRGDSTLMKEMTWSVQSGQHWWIAGGNGAGKSTLSRLLARNEPGIVEGSMDVSGDEPEPGERRNTVGWVSTESHMALARSALTAEDVLTQHSPQHETIPMEVAKTVLEWLDLPTSDEFLQRPFGQLSQGEQKLILIAAAVSSRPQLLVLDEPCQGLDWIRRQKVLGLVERLCQAAKSEMSLVYITHHPEEVNPSISHVLHLAKGQDVYQGTRQDYDADAVGAVAEALEEREKEKEKKS